MKYPVKNIVFTGLVLPNLILTSGTISVPLEVLPKWGGVNSGVINKELLNQEPLELNLREPLGSSLKVDLNSVNPVTVEEGVVKITWAKSNYDLKRAQTVALAVRTEPEPAFEAKRALVQKIADDKGIDPKILEAVWQVESGKSWNTARRSGAGATGPAQFMPGTFRKYGEDYDGDGVASITDAQDSLAAAANLLIANGLKDGKVRSALLAYNRADWYVKKVLKVAESIE